MRARIGVPPAPPQHFPRRISPFSPREGDPGLCRQETSNGSDIVLESGLRELMAGEAPPLSVMNAADYILNSSGIDPERTAVGMRG